MKKEFIIALFFVLFSIFTTAGKLNAIAPVKDKDYKIATSTKYTIGSKWADAQLTKVVVDSDNSVFVLTKGGDVYRDFPNDVLAKDFMYSSLSDKKAIDIAIQEGTGYLYYLYGDRFLSNRHAGTICGHLPANKYSHFAINANYDVLLLGSSEAVLFNKSEKKSELSLPKGTFVKLYAHNNTFWYLTTTSINCLNGRSWKEIHKGQNLTALAFKGSQISVATSDGFYTIDKQGKKTENINANLPVSSIKDLQVIKDELWLTTSRGAFVQKEKDFRYYAGSRWLNNDEVVDIASDKKGDVYLLTKTGLNKIVFKNETLAEKAESIHDDLRKYHLRFGFSAESRLINPDDPTTIILEDDDNDGLWTSFYVGSQAFRYATTGEECARQYVWESFEPYERLINIHPITGFSGRTFERTGYIAGDTVPWRPAIDKDWWWKGTTSTDEFVGHMFVAAVIDLLVAKTPEEKARVTNYFDAIMNHIVSNDYYFIDYDGKPTLWGRWNPDHVNSFATTQYDRRLNSMLTIAGLQLAYQLTQKEIYKTEAYRMIKDHGYLENMKIPMKNIKFTEGFKYQGISMGEDWNHSDDEMAFLTHWVLYHYAFDNDLKKEYAELIKDHWEIEKPERHALWNLLTYATTKDIDQESTVWYLREFPRDLRRHQAFNSHRKDIEHLPQDLLNNFRDQKTKELLPQAERPLNRHNNNEFIIDGGRGSHFNLAGDEYLLPYWMARYLKVIE